MPRPARGRPGQRLPKAARPCTSERLWRHSAPVAARWRQQQAYTGDKERRTQAKTPRCMRETEGDQGTKEEWWPRSSMAASMAAVASERQGARGAMERRERVSGVEGEPLASTRESAGALVHAAWRWNAARAWPPRTGHASSVGAFPRTPGEQRIDHGGA